MNLRWALIIIAIQCLSACNVHPVSDAQVAAMIEACAKRDMATRVHNTTLASWVECVEVKR